MLYYPLLVIGYLLSLLPFRVHYMLSDLLYLAVYRLLGYRRRVVRSNLKSSFPEKTPGELRQIERCFYHSLCDYFVETVKMASMTEKQMRRHIVFHHTELIDESVEAGQSVALFLGHVFNWEWVVSMPLWLKPEANCGQLYHALENPTIDRLFLRLRQRWGAVCIALTDILRKTIEYKRQGKVSVIGYIGDQVPHWNNIHHWCQFLNHDTPVMTGAERIARKNRQALIYLDIRRLRRGYYECDFRLITRHPEQMAEYEPTDMYYQMLEETIRRQPELWLWSHNRWKRTREEFNRRFKVVGGKVIETIKE